MIGFQKRMRERVGEMIHLKISSTLINIITIGRFVPKSK